jgi:hypothetical protein
MVRRLGVAVAVVVSVLGAVATPAGAQTFTNIPAWAVDGANAIYDGCLALPGAAYNAASSGTGATIGAMAPWFVHGKGTPNSTLGPSIGQINVSRWLAGTAQGAQAMQAPVTATAAATAAAAAASQSTAVVAAGSSTTAVAVSGGATAATGGVALSASTVGLGALTFVGVGCTTVNVLDWAFGSRGEAYKGPQQTVMSNGLERCSDLGLVPGAWPNDRCLRLSWQNPAGTNWVVRVAHINEQGTTGSAYDYLLRNSSGNVVQNVAVPSGATSLTVPIACQEWDNNCGLAPNGATLWSGTLNGTPTPTMPSPPGYNTVRINLSSSPFTLVGTGTVDTSGRLDRGWRLRLHNTTVCREPGTTATTTVMDVSPTFWESEGRVHWPDAAKCPMGHAPISTVVKRQARVGGAAQVGTWKDYDTVLDWGLPSSVRNNDTSLACFVRGATSCPIHDASPGNTAGNVALGGATGAEFPKSAMQDTPRQQVHNGQEQLDWAAQEPAPVPRTGGTPGTGPGTGTGTGQGPQDTEPVPSADADGANCWAEGWSWNPVSWVLVPVKCALMWAFWDQGTADGFGDLWGERIGPWVAFLSGTVGSFGFSPAAGPCIDMDAAEICTQGVLDVEMPPPVVVFFTALMAVGVTFEVVGLFARVTGAGKG